MAVNILVVDDEPRFLRLLEANLRTEGYQVITAQNGKEAIEIFSVSSVDLILLDVLMPQMDGFTVCQRIRQYSNVPIIILTAKGEEQDRIRGLDVSADDYLVKPFSVMELLARVRAVLRRAQISEPGQDRFFAHGNLRIDLARAEVWRDDNPVFLSATEYRLLLHFAHNVGKVVTAEDLLENVWGPEYRSDREILWVTIARLRHKIEDDPHDPKHIVTRSGLGYLMSPEE